MFKLLEPPCLVDVETAVLLAPGVVGVLTDVDVPNCLCNAAAFGDGNFNLPPFMRAQFPTFNWTRLRGAGQKELTVFYRGAFFDVGWFTGPALPYIGFVVAVDSVGVAGSGYQRP